MQLHQYDAAPAPQNVFLLWETLELKGLTQHFMPDRTQLWFRRENGGGGGGCSRGLYRNPQDPYTWGGIFGHLRQFVAG
jgi:hypothetical protein